MLPLVAGAIAVAAIVTVGVAASGHQGAQDQPPAPAVGQHVGVAPVRPSAKAVPPADSRPVTWSADGLAELRQLLGRQVDSPWVQEIDLHPHGADVWVQPSSGRYQRDWVWSGQRGVPLQDETGETGSGAVAFDIRTVHAAAVEGLVHRLQHWLGASEKAISVEIDRYAGRQPVTVVVDGKGPRGDGRLIGFLDGRVRNRVLWHR